MSAEELEDLRERNRALSARARRAERQARRLRDERRELAMTVNYALGWLDGAASMLEGTPRGDAVRAAYELVHDGALNAARVGSIVDAPTPNDPTA